MIYTITKITITQTAADLLISKMARAVRECEPMDLDKGVKEILFTSDDGLIDIYFSVSFNSEYKAVDGGVQCTGRGVVASVKMCIAETGEEVSFDCPVGLGEEIEKMFWI